MNSKRQPPAEMPREFCGLCSFQSLVSFFIYFWLSLFSVIYCSYYRGISLLQMQSKTVHIRPKSIMCPTLLSELQHEFLWHRVILFSIYFSSNSIINFSLKLYLCVLIGCWFPVLLEGSPGVGKTSLITALGKYSGHKVVRINLSEQVSPSLFLLGYKIGWGSVRI